MNKRGEKRPGTHLSSSYGMPKKLRKPSSMERKTNELNIKIARGIMAKIKSKLIKHEHKYEDHPCKNLIEYVRENISKLDTGTKKKTTVGVFGKTGAGKSSLINAILGEGYLLPSATLSACTSVIIQVEANVTDSNYTAEIEFLSIEEWEVELQTLLNVLSEDVEERDNSMFSTANEKITALYGKSVVMTLENLMKDENFLEIPEFLTSEIKEIKCEKASDLSEKIHCYVQNDKSSPGGCYWPVVKSVTIKVPNCKDFLEHVLLVDLPGSGDYNKSRDQMWRSKLRDCSTVWIISEINRAGSEKDAWEIVSDSITDMAQGGECSSLSFICTKTDDINPHNYMRSLKLKDIDFLITSKDSQYRNKKRIACILHRNGKAKDLLREDFLQQETIKKHLNCGEDLLNVFTVSSEEFTSEDPILKPEQTEIPELRKLLKMYNNRHTNERMHYYISGALGILSLIQGSKESDGKLEERSRLFKKLELDLDHALEHLHEYCGQIKSSLETLLSKGATESEGKSLEIANEVISTIFYQTFSALCRNDGFFRSRKGIVDLNSSLAKPMLQHIESAFMEFFPTSGKATEKSLLTKLSEFTIITKDMVTKYERFPVLCHMLKFLEMEEKHLKKILLQEIIKQKKEIYASISKSIQKKMQPCYRETAAIRGQGSMKTKQYILLSHVESSKREMFQETKKKMLEILDNTMHLTVEKLRTGLIESMRLSLLNKSTLPFMDITHEMEALKKLLSQE